MIEKAVNAINNATRNITINHPNNYNAVILRKVLNRTATASEGGIPTLGGVAVLDSEDEEDYAFTSLGNAFVLSVNDPTDGIMNGRMDVAEYGSEEEFYLIEPETAGAFIIELHDVMYKIIGAKVRLAYEITTIHSVNNIYPYSYKYGCNLRNDLHITLP